MPRSRQHSRSRSSRPAARPSRAPIAFGAAALLVMLALAVWAARGLPRTQPVASEQPTPTPATSGLPVVTPAEQPAERPETPVAGMETPTLEATPTPTPPPPVVVGAFGELPAANLPQSPFPPGQVAVTFERAFDLAGIPREAPVYRLVPPQWNETRVGELARELGIEGAVERTGAGSFVVRSPAGQLIVTDFTVQYQAAEPAPTPSPAETEAETPEPTPTEQALPPDSFFVQAARDWLERHRLVSTPLDAGRVRERIESRGVAIVTFGPAEPSPVLSAVPGATLAVARDGSVRQAFVSWPAAMESSTYSLRPVDALWQDVENNRGTLDIDESVFRQASLPLRGTARITQVELAWVDAGHGTERYLTPVVRFRGTATFEGYPEPVPVTVTVPAVAAQATPRG